MASRSSNRMASLMLGNLGAAYDGPKERAPRRPRRCVLVAAARSTWSPCGLSMLSTITPMGSGLAGTPTAARPPGSSSGPCSAASPWVRPGRPCSLPAWPALDPRSRCRPGRRGRPGPRRRGLRRPTRRVRALGHTRQVNEVWLDRYRSWVYGAGFGYVIGVGLATYIVTAAVYLTIALAALTGEPATAFVILTGFGLARVCRSGVARRPPSNGCRPCTAGSTRVGAVSGRHHRGAGRPGGGRRHGGLRRRCGDGGHDRRRRRRPGRAQPAPGGGGCASNHSGLTPPPV